MERESKVILEVDASMEADDPTTAKKFQKSRLSMALIALSLCLASGAAVFLFSSAPVTVSPCVFICQIPSAAISQ